MPFINPYTFVPIEKKEPERKVPPHIEMIQEKGQETKEAQSCLQTREQEAKGDAQSDQQTYGSEAKGDALLSGYIECDLEIKSSLFIPNTSKAFHYLDCRYTDHKGKKCDYKSVHSFQEFYSYDDLSDKEEQEGEQVPTEAPSSPRIPGSEIRGVIRSIYEQLTNSCFSVIDEENYPTRRSPVPKQPGLLDLKNRKLYPTERVMLNTTSKACDGYYVGEKYHTGSVIYFEKSNETYKTTKNDREIDTGFHYAENVHDKRDETRLLKGIVLIGNKFSQKHHDSVFLADTRAGESETISKDDLTRFQRVLDEYKKTGESSDYITYYNKVKKALKIKNTDGKDRIFYLPVFYSKVQIEPGEYAYYLSPSMITRDFFSSTINQILKKNNNHHCCDGENQKWCPACRLFGMVGKGEEKNSLASRVRFGDTEVLNKVEYDSTRILKILGNPRISSTEFYLEKPTIRDFPDVHVWNYDYVTANQSVGRTMRIKRMAYVSTLKGRKVYWLGKDLYSTFSNTDELKRELEQLKRHSTDEERLAFRRKYALKQTQSVRPIKTGKTSFKVYFDDVTKEELQLLLFSLSLGKSTECYYHRIGRGKPFGMGAVKISLVKLVTRDYNLKDGVVELETKELKNDDILDEYPIPSSYDVIKRIIQKYSQKLPAPLDEQVGYPMSEGNIYSWFVKNRGKVNEEKIKITLPAISDTVQTLPDYN